MSKLTQGATVLHNLYVWGVEGKGERRVGRSNEEEWDVPTATVRNKVKKKQNNEKGGEGDEN